MSPIGSVGRSVRGRRLPDAIPDSEADQKLAHRWILNEESDPFEDSEGSYDGTNIGTTQVTNGYAGGAARYGDGTDDYISFGNLGSWGSNHGTSFAIALTIETTDSATVDVCGHRSEDAANWRFVQLNDSTDGDVFVSLRDRSGGASGDRLSARTGDIGANDGKKHRLVINVVDSSNNDVEIWLDQSEQSITLIETTGPNDWSNIGDDGGEWISHAREDRGDIINHSDTVIDDHCLYTDSLTENEIQSYDNPWV